MEALYSAAASESAAPPAGNASPPVVSLDQIAGSMSGVKDAFGKFGAVSGPAAMTSDPAALEFELKFDAVEILSGFAGRSIAAATAAGVAALQGVDRMYLSTAGSTITVRNATWAWQAAGESEESDSDGVSKATVAASQNGKRLHAYQLLNTREANGSLQILFRLGLGLGLGYGLG